MKNMYLAWRYLLATIEIGRTEVYSTISVFDDLFWGWMVHNEGPV